MEENNKVYNNNSETFEECETFFKSECMVLKQSINKATRDLVPMLK